MAKDILSRKGYKNIRNAGGLVDVFYPKKNKAATGGWFSFPWKK